MIAAEELKNDAIYQANQNDDKFLLALGDRKLAEEMRDDAKAKGDAAGTQAWNTALANSSMVKSRNSKATKLAALSAHAATGYNLDDGQAGYNQMAKSFLRAQGISESDTSQVVKDNAGNITGVRGAYGGAFATYMNQSQYNAKNAGRYDLAGINNGDGYDAETGLGKADPYSLATRGKPSSIKEKGRLVEQYRLDALTALDAAGSSTDPRIQAEQMAKYEEKMQAAEIHRLELENIYNSATGKNRDTAFKALESISESGPTIGPLTPEQTRKRAANTQAATWSSTDTGQTTKRRVNYDAAVVTGAGYTGTPWTVAERNRGWRIEERDVTNLDTARSRARGANRPNPAELED